MPPGAGCWETSRPHGRRASAVRLEDSAHEPVDDRLELADVVGLARAQLARGQLDDRADAGERVVARGEARRVVPRRDALVVAVDRVGERLEDRVAALRRARA